METYKNSIKTIKYTFCPCNNKLFDFAVSYIESVIHQDVNNKLNIFASASHMETNTKYVREPVVV